MQSTTISFENNHNNRKRKDQLNMSPSATAVAQSVDPTPAGQSLAQQQMTPLDGFGQQMGAVFPQRTAPTSSEQMWQDRQQRAMTNPVLNTLFSKQYTPLQAQNIEGIGKDTNAMIQNIVGIKNANAQNAWNQAHQNTIMAMLDREGKIYNQDTSNMQSGMNAAMRQEGGQDTLGLMKKRMGVVDGLLPSIGGFDGLDPLNSDHAKLVAQVKSRYAQTGELPTSFVSQPNGWFSSKMVPMYDGEGESDAPQSSTLDEDTLMRDYGFDVRRININTK